MEKKEYIIPESRVKKVVIENSLLAGSPLDFSSDTPSTTPDPTPYTGPYSAKEMIDFILDQVN